MPVIGLTGGVATGKSTTARLLSKKLGETRNTECFSADDAAHEIMNTDAGVLSSIRVSFGDRPFREDGGVDRAILREMIFASPELRKNLESILHPVIREKWITRSEEYRGAHKFFIAEIPLLYETLSASSFDCVIVVAASRLEQERRLSETRGWSLDTARRVIDSQWPLEEKIRRSDILIWNDYLEETLHRQVALAAETLKICYA